jgi:hypothetical protein
MILTALRLANESGSVMMCVEDLPLRPVAILWFGSTLLERNNPHQTRRSHGPACAFQPRRPESVRKACERRAKPHSHHSEHRRQIVPGLPDTACAILAVILESNDRGPDASSGLAFTTPVPRRKVLPSWQ